MKKNSANKNPNLNLENIDEIKTYVTENGTKSMQKFVKHALENQYLTEEEANFIQSLRKISVGRACKAIASLLCFIYKKPFNELSDEELDHDQVKWVYDIYKLGRRNPRMLLQEARIHYGLTEKVLKQKTYKTWLEKVSEEYPDYKVIFEKFTYYMKSNGYSKPTMDSYETSIKQLFEFMEEQQKMKLSEFNGDKYVKFHDWLAEKGNANSSIFLKIIKVKNFMAWGISDFECFPKVLDYPETFSSSLSRKVEEEREESDGRAFPIEGLAEKIAKACYEYNPSDENEELFKSFWLIASSCPVRFEFIRNLSVDCMELLLNSNGMYGLTSSYEDKGGNVNGQFPILDRIGVEVIRKLQKRVEMKQFQPILNQSNKQKYVHLFQLDEYPYLVPSDWFRNFLHEKIIPTIPEVKEFEERNGQKIEIGSHGFRHFIATKVQAETRDTKATQFVLGHHDIEMTMQYLRSRVSKNTLLYSIVDGYEKKELSGKFYLHLLDILSNDEYSNNEIFEAMTKEMELKTFLKQYGKKRDMGWCMAQEHCETYYRCWGCQHFLLRKEEIEEAIEKLAKYTINHKSLMENSKNFSYDNPIAADSIKKIALIQKRIMDLGIPSEKVWEMVKNKMQGKNIKEALKND